MCPIIFQIHFMFPFYLSVDIWWPVISKVLCDPVLSITPPHSVPNAWGLIFLWDLKTFIFDVWNPCGLTQQHNSHFNVNGDFIYLFFLPGIGTSGSSRDSHIHTHIWFYGYCEDEWLWPEIVSLLTSSPWGYVRTSINLEPALTLARWC